MFDLEYNMHLYQQCTAKKNKKNSDDTQNTVSKGRDQRGRQRPHLLTIVIQREGLPKIAFIPEKEYIYIYFLSHPLSQKGGDDTFTK